MTNASVRYAPYMLERLQVELRLGNAYDEDGDDEDPSRTRPAAVWDVVSLHFSIPDTLVAIVHPVTTDTCYVPILVSSPVSTNSPTLRHQEHRSECRTVVPPLKPENNTPASVAMYLVADTLPFVVPLAVDSAAIFISTILTLY